MGKCLVLSRSGLGRQRGELKKTNRHKNGLRFVYGDKLFAPLAVIKTLTEIADSWEGRVTV